MKTTLLVIATSLFACAAARCAVAVDLPAVKVRDAIEPVVPVQVGGILGERLDLWRRVRLWRVLNDPFLLGGFKNPPGMHPWQGEHIGKWLHAASLAAEASGDEKLQAALANAVSELIATQQDNGYLGTYAPAKRYYAKAKQGDPTSWDIWTERYVVHGLLAYCKMRDDPAAIQASRRVVDLLMKTVGPPSGDISRFGTRHGLSAAILLESVVLLYQQTGDAQYLDFAKYLVQTIERHPELALSAAMREGKDVTVVGDGKAYQLMSRLLGYVELYRSTGEKQYLEPAVAAWDRIQKDHINVAGGPWSYQVKKYTNEECFAPRGYFHPTNCIETCSTTTWIQFCLSLFELTGEARYADAAELSILNQLIGAQSPNGGDWAYHSMLNMPERGYDNSITCCASSGPRALEVYARHLVCQARDRVIVNSYLPGVFELRGGEEAGKSVGRLVVEGSYPFEPSCTLRFDIQSSAKLAVDFRMPVRAASLKIAVNGEAVKAEKTADGFYRIQREWKSGDRVSLAFDYLLQAHFETASDNDRWVAFSWGPLTLAQTIEKQTDQPQNVLVVEQESDKGEVWLERELAGKKESRASADAIEEFDTNSSKNRALKGDSTLSWRLKTPRRIILVPYYQAGANGGGVRSMFPTRREPF